MRGGTSNGGMPRGGGSSGGTPSRGGSPRRWGGVVEPQVEVVAVVEP